MTTLLPKTKAERGQGRKRGGKNRNYFEIEKLSQQMKLEITEFILQGYSLTEVTDYLELNYNLDVENARRYYRLAHLEILEFGEFDIETIIIQHVFYYEEAARYFDSVGDYVSKSIAMNAKEKLLKLFEDEDNEIEVNNNVNINVDQLSYDMSKLNVQEQNRFNELFQKVRLLSANKQ